MKPRSKRGIRTLRLPIGQTTGPNASMSLRGELPTIWSGSGTANRSDTSKGTLHAFTHRGGTMCRFRGSSVWHTNAVTTTETSSTMTTGPHDQARMDNHSPSLGHMTRETHQQVSYGTSRPQMTGTFVRYHDRHGRRAAATSTGARNARTSTACTTCATSWTSSTGGKRL